MLLYFTTSMKLDERKAYWLVSPPNSTSYDLFLVFQILDFNKYYLNKNVEGETKKCIYVRYFIITKHCPTF